MKVAGVVMELHSECIQKAKAIKAAAAAAVATQSLLSSPPDLPPPPPIPNMFRSDSSEIAEMTNMLNQSVLADPAGTIFSATEHVLTEKRNFDEDLHLPHDGETVTGARSEQQSSNSLPERFFGENSALRYSGIDVRNTKTTITPRKISTVDRMNSLPLLVLVPPLITLLS
jgi:hypothetical protein